MNRPSLPSPLPYHSSQQPIRLLTYDPLAPLQLQSQLQPQSLSPPPRSTKPTYSKRGRITIVACLPCRRRKTKCDGKRPACSQCLGRESRCQYDMTDEQRRLTYLRETVEQLEREKNELESLFLMLQRASENDVFQVMRELRIGNGSYALASDVSTDTNTLRAPPSSTKAKQYRSLIHVITTAQTPELNEILRRLRAGHEPAAILASVRSDTLLQDPAREAGDQSGMEIEVASQEQLALVRGTASGGHHDIQRIPDALIPPVNHWTTVTFDQQWIDYLLSVYFSWQHQIFLNLPEPLFRADMASGRTDFCSKMLVNSLCAAACLLSDTRRDQTSPVTAGWDFFEEAVKLLGKEQSSTLTTTAALSILSHIESSFSRSGLQWHYSGRGSRMALDLNLHLCSDAIPADPRGSEAVIANTRNRTFWSCFITDQICSFTLGRVPLIPSNAITVDTPPVELEKEDAEWAPPGLVVRAKKSLESTTFRQAIALSKIVNSTLQIFFAPSRPINGNMLLEEYNKYTQWFAELPDALRSTENAPPHVISLHDIANKALQEVLSNRSRRARIFSAFPTSAYLSWLNTIKARFTESNISPREECRQSANKISKLCEQHRQLYGLDGIFAFQLHCLLTACTIHIIKLPSISATTHLAAACNIFQDLCRQNHWATRSLDIIRSLTHSWKIVLPLEVEHALYRNQPFSIDLSEVPSTASNASSEIHPNAQGISNAFDPSSSSVIGLPGGSFLGKRGAPFASLTASEVPQKRQRLAPPQHVPATSQQQLVMHRLFTPLPHQQAPLLSPIHTSTSQNKGGRDAEHGQPMSLDRGIDGLDFAADDGFDPFMGFPGVRQ